MYIVYVMSCEGKGNFDVSTLAHDMTYTSSILGQPGKFTMTLEKDPNNVLEISIGDKVLFMVDGKMVFSGKIFTLGTNRNETYSITAYDQMRYLQNHDYLNLDGEENKSLEDIFTKICTSAELTYTIKAPSPWVLEPHLFIDKSYFEILTHCITETNTKNEKMFFIRDKGGILELNEVGVCQAEAGTPLIIGTGSLLTDYNYSVDIDKETYTEVLLMENIKTSSKNSDKEQTSKKLVYAKADAETGRKWGRLRRIVNVKEQASKEELEEYAQLNLEVFAKSSKTMKLEALGYPVYAGDSFKLMLDKLGLCMDLYIKEATHTYGEVHTMSLNVATNRNMPDTLGKLEVKA